MFVLYSDVYQFVTNHNFSLIIQTLLPNHFLSSLGIEVYKEIYIFVNIYIFIKKFTRNLGVSLEFFEWQTQVFVDVKIFLFALCICSFFSKVYTTEKDSYWRSVLQ